MQPGIYQRHGCQLHLSGFMWAYPQQAEMYHSERSDNAVFPKCLLLDKSQRKELQK